MRISYANVASTLALVVALGTGGAYAANQLPKNSVGAKQLQKNAVTTKKVKDGSLTAADLARGAIPPSAVGTTMGGDLTGTFPNPKVNVTGLSGVLKGTRTSASLALPTGSVQTILTVPGIGALKVYCTQASISIGLGVELVNNSGQTLKYIVRRQAEDPPLNDVQGGTLNPGNTFSLFLGPSPAGPVGRSVELVMVDGPVADIEVDGLTNVNGGGCLVRATAITG